MPDWCLFLFFFSAGNAVHLIGYQNGGKDLGILK